MFTGIVEEAGRVVAFTQGERAWRLQVAARTTLAGTAIGDSINTTKRLQENAAKNQIVISREAYLRVKDYVSVIMMEPMTVKGKREQIPVYEVLGLK